VIGIFFVLRIADISVHFARADMDRYKNDTLISCEKLLAAQRLRQRPPGRVNINFHAKKIIPCNLLLSKDNFHIDICRHMPEYVTGTVVTLPQHDQGAKNYVAKDT
jgi:hypothetical protein